MLKGNLVNVRVAEREDIPLIVGWGNDLEFGGEFEPVEQNSLQDIEKRYSNLRLGEKWFIIEKKDGTKIGQIVHSPLKRHFQIGFAIIPGERGKGYCTEAVKIMVDYLFLSSSIMRIEAETHLNNTASQRVLEKAGFTKEGVLRKATFTRGEWLDEALYSIIREEWKEPRILKD